MTFTILPKSLLTLSGGEAVRFFPCLQGNYLQISPHFPWRLTVISTVKKMNPPGFCSFSDLPVDVKEIKQRLLSRDKEQQSQIVEIIKEYLQDEEVVVKLITNDIPEFLCDALVPFDSGNTR